MKRLPPFVVTRMDATQSTAAEHPDAGLLTAFAEGNLSPRERASVLTHLAECPVCREVLAVRSMAVVPPVPRKTIPWKWRIAALAATFCVVVAGTWEMVRRNPSLKVPEVPKTGHAAVSTSDELALQATRPAVAVPKATNSKKRHRSVVVAENSTLKPSAMLDQPVNPEQSRAQFQKQAALPQRMLSSPMAVAPASPFLAAPAPNAQILWSLEALPRDGTIRKSEDAGRIWKTIVVDDATPIYAVSANGLSIWVGGANGKLFHSEDGGSTWNPVQLVYQGELVNDSVTWIDARPDSVKVKTASGLTFVSTDAGAQWARQ